MRTSKQVHAQVLWDERLDPARFALRIDMHRPEPKVVSFTAFDPDGDIPWHRVLAYTCDGTPCWDREGLDRLDALAESGLFAPRRLQPPFWEARAAVRFDGTAWVSWTGSPEVKKTLTLLTWNILWDRFQPELLASDVRWPRLIDEVLSSGADVVALQEVTPGFHRLLLAHPEIRASWWVSHAPGHPDVGAADLLLLGRGSVTELGFCKLRPHKAALGAVLGAGPLVVTTHLSSDHSKNAKVRREEELQRIQLASEVELGAVWMGDFNLSAEEPILDTRDAWTLLQPAEPTFDPVLNPLAVHSSKSGRPVRIDRVLLRGPWTPTKARRVGLQATEGLYPSDHFGVEVELALDAPPAAWLGAPSRRTALAWLPRDVAAIDAVRAERDPSFLRWPAHVNLLWPFVPESDFEEIASLLEGLSMPAFPSSFCPGSFPGRRPTQFLKPIQRAPWTQLIQLLRTRFPTCTPPGEPHLTVARDSDALPELALEEPVETLCLLSRRGDGRFEVRARWDLSGALEFVDPPVAVRQASPCGPLPEQAELVGSRRLGAALEGADVDLLWFGEGAGAHFAGHTVREVEKAGLPGLVVHSRPRIDVVILPEACRGADRLEQDGPVCHALTALSDADVLLERVKGREGLFQEVLRQVKGWARAQLLDEPALGGLEGLAWAVLVAETLGQEAPRDELLRFFAHWATWDWEEGVGCDGAGDVAIGTPSAPHRVITERALRRPLEAALWEAWETLDGGAPLEVLQAPVPWHRQHAEAVWVQTSTHEAEGWALGRARALVELLGDVRPRRLPGGFALGLPRDCDPTAVDTRVQGWSTHPGVDARRAWTWEVP